MKKLTRSNLVKKTLKKSSLKIVKKKRLIKGNPKKILIKKHIKAKRPIHKKFIMNPLAVMLILCLSVFLINWTFHVIADSFTVTAEVKAPLLTEGAYITYPPDNTVFHNQKENVSGTCPSNSYVKLYDNNTFKGVAWCTLSNQFVITIDLFSGRNDLRAQDYNVTNQQGPVTPIVSISYIPGDSSTNIIPKSKSVNTTPIIPPTLLIISDFKYQVYNSDYSWTINVSGGSYPIQANVNWGDGNNSVYYLSSEIRTFNIKHRYGQYGYYRIIVTASDVSNNVSSLQLAALIRDPGAVGIFTPTVHIVPPSVSEDISIVTYLKSNLKIWFIIAWPSLIIVLLMLTSYWLGEREEYHRLYNKVSVRQNRSIYSPRK